MNFLYRDASPRFPDDVVATDFFTVDEWADIIHDRAGWRNIRSQQEHQVLVRAESRTGKEIAHLSYKRLETRGWAKLWPSNAIVKALATDLTRFVHQVPADRVHEGFKGIYLAIGGPAELTAARSEPGTPLMSLDDGSGGGGHGVATGPIGSG